MAQTLSPSERSLRSRIGAHTLHARYDSTALTEPARAASWAALDKRLLAEIDPDNRLHPDERARRLGHARAAHFARLALKSAQTRRARRQRKAAAV